MLADYFEFTSEERNVINTTEYPKREYTLKNISCKTQEGGRSHRTTRKIRRI